MEINNKVKDIDIKNRLHYFFNDIINIESFNPNNIKIDENPYKNIIIYYIEYVTIKKYVKICSANSLYFIFRGVNEYFEKINKSKFLVLFPTNESKEKTKTHKELYNKIRDLIRSITKNSDGYYKKIYENQF